MKIKLIILYFLFFFNLSFNSVEKIEAHKLDPFYYIEKLPNNINCYKDSEGNTFLHYAILFGNIEDVKKIILAGGIFLQNNKNQTPLSLACIKRNNILLHRNNRKEHLSLLNNSKSIGLLVLIENINKSIYRFDSNLLLDSLSVLKKEYNLGLSKILKSLDNNNLLLTLLDLSRKNINIQNKLPRSLKLAIKLFDKLLNNYDLDYKLSKKLIIFSKSHKLNSLYMLLNNIYVLNKVGISVDILLNHILLF